MSKVHAGSFVEDFYWSYPSIFFFKSYTNVLCLVSRSPIIIISVSGRPMLNIGLPQRFPDRSDIFLFRPIIKKILDYLEDLESFDFESDAFESRIKSSLRGAQVTSLAPPSPRGPRPARRNKLRR